MEESPTRRYAWYALVAGLLALAAQGCGCWWLLAHTPPRVAEPPDPAELLARARFFNHGARGFALIAIGCASVGAYRREWGVVLGLAFLFGLLGAFLEFGPSAFAPA